MKSRTETSDFRMEKMLVVSWMLGEGPLLVLSGFCHQGQVIKLSSAPNPGPENLSEWKKKAKARKSKYF